MINILCAEFVRNPFRVRHIQAKPAKMKEYCNVCASELDKPVFVSVGGNSITSMCQLLDGDTTIYLCRTCGHLKTQELPDLQKFYSLDYEININSEEDDQLYEVIGSKKKFRAEKQAELFLDKLELPDHAKILDYGSAKGATLRKICEKRLDVTPYLFDVTEKYISFWGKFASPENWSCHSVRNEWKGLFDVITSFYAFEHIADLRGCLATIHRLLNEKGILYLMVPNVYMNIADFVVVDHVNHFCPESMRCLLAESGFAEISIDETSFTAAFVVKATKTHTSSFPRSYFDLAKRQEKVLEICRFWENIGGKIAKFENNTDDTTNAALYGAGFYGAFIFSQLRHPWRVKCIIDENPFLQNTEMFDLPIFAPDDLPDSVSTVYVGLNPQNAEDIIAQTALIKSNRLKFMYL